MRGWTFGLLAAAVAGCGTRGDNPSTLVPAQGKVVTADGRPVPFVEVNFVPTERGGAIANGVTGKDGTFSPKSLNNEPGIAAGKYRVGVGPAPGKAGSAPKLDPKLADDVSSGLTAEVSSGTTELIITLP